MRVVHLNPDRGIPLLGCKGGSIHVRSMLRALAPRVERLTTISVTVTPRKGPSVPVDSIPARIVELEVPRDRDEIHETNEAVADALVSLHREGDLDLLYERLSLHAIAGSQIARRLGVPHVVEVNAPLTDEAARYRSLRWPTLARFCEAGVLRDATAVVVVSRELADWVTQWGVESDRVLVLPNGCDTTLFRPADAAMSRASAGGLTIAFVGSLKPWHGLDILSRAFTRLRARLPSVRLLIIGDGPERANLEAQLRETLPEGAYEFTGLLPQEEVARRLQDADLAVAPYPEIGPFYFSPLKLMEYCAAGLPVVASRIGQIRELLSHDENALLVPAGDVDALADALHELCEDGERRERIARSARRLAEGRSWDAAVSRLLEWLPEHIPANREVLR